jgi:hypothetical protein
MPLAAGARLDDPDTGITGALMDVNRQDLERRYADVNDQELLDRYASGTLTELAESVVRAELRRRGLTPPEAPAPSEDVAPAAIPRAAGPLVPIAAQLTWSEANILCSLLHSEGIAAEPMDAYLATAHPILSSVTGGIRILVPESNLARVHEVIAALKRGDYALEEDVDPSANG